MARIAPRFARVESRRLARDAVAGLMSRLAVKNCWTRPNTPVTTRLVACSTCCATPHDDGVRDDLRRYVVERLGEVDAVLVVDLCRPRNYAEALAG